MAPNQSIYFTGTCIDCSGTATATLDLSGDYVFGDTISPSVIVDFVYNGTDLVSGFTLTTFTFSGRTIPVGFTSGGLDIYLGGSTASGASWNFYTGSSGGWGLCNDACADYGTSGTWSTSNSSAGTPEPASWALFGGAVAASAIRRRLLTR